ncbi:hypothetical protein [Maribacter polysaccharolyticus]|uniref:hypothetical protein n=1 Tax=Maribacter polysaccharolyticus TaxID=3020831 RepID=UPI00237FBBB0|nr:hypothetical protein [Maribacter polysaccharolyticus]MDE3741916.1 hypothetical protein [Maribacter polysaccharolyticus]
MAQDLRGLFEKEKCNEKFTMNHGHEKRFADRLASELPQKRKSSFFIVRIAATILVLIGVITFFVLERDRPEIPTTVVDKHILKEGKIGISLGDLSPDLKKVESYYVANINLELAKLDVSVENREVVDGYMERLADLNKEYKNLTAELNQIGPNDQTISALIKNLQLRLQLLQQLKMKLREVQSSKNEEYGTNAI